MLEQELSDTQPLERNRTVPFDKLLDAVGVGNVQPDVLSSLAGRLAKLERRLAPDDRKAIGALSGGLGWTRSSRSSTRSGGVRTGRPDRAPDDWTLRLARRSEMRYL